YIRALAADVVAFSILCYDANRSPTPFPTRRSSDLADRAARAHLQESQAPDDHQDRHDHRGQDAEAELPAALAFEAGRPAVLGFRSEEHTSELQSRGHLGSRLLLEKKNTQYPSRRST